MAQTEALLALLADGRFHSGEQLGCTLGISRAAVWKALQRIPELGLEVHSVRGRGHRLVRPIQLLDRERVLAALDATVARRLAGLELHHSIDSTNAELMRRSADLSSGHACLAERQTAGRGRRGRHWTSPFGANVYLSLFWRFPFGAAGLGGLSLALAVAAAEALEDLGARGVGVKWPNDLLFDGRKLAGILVEVGGDAEGQCHVVAGFGVNVGMPPGAPVDQPWADLREAGGTADRNQVAAMLLTRVFHTLGRFELDGPGTMLQEWRRRDILTGRPIRLHLPHGERDGIARGIDGSGQLLAEIEGDVEAFSYGEVSVRQLD